MKINTDLLSINTRLSFSVAFFTFTFFAFQNISFVPSDTNTKVNYICMFYIILKQTVATRAI